MAVRVLIAGDVKGKFKELNDKVKQVVSKSGAFHLLLCVGHFFDSQGTSQQLHPGSRAKTSTQGDLKETFVWLSPSFITDR